MPLAVLAVVLAMLAVEHASIDHELALVIPGAAAPGSIVPARALLFDRLDAPEGPRLTSAPVELSLADDTGAVRARTTLAASPAGGAEGAIELPSDLAGRVRVVAVARVDGEAVASVRTSLEVRPDPPRLVPTARLASPLQQLELGPIRGSVRALDARVVGGACVPEEPCELLVHCDPPAALALAEAASLTVRTREAEGGLARFEVVVHGPEARSSIVAMRNGEEIARRAIQLPVALATPAVEVSPRAVARSDEVRVRARVLGDRPAVLVQAFRDGVWARTGSLPPSGRATALPFELPPGVWHLQFHGDPFSAERSAVRVVVVGDPPEAVELAAPAPPGPEELRLSWAAAAREEAIHPLPDEVSGRADDLARLSARRRALRIATAVALALGLVVAAALVSLRGLEAAREAHEVMRATGDPELASARHRRRTLLSALALVAAAILAFVGAAALIVARTHLVE